MRIVWVGCHEEGIVAFKNTLERGRNVSAFITLDEHAFSKRSAGSRKYQSYCEKYQVPYYMVESIKGEQAYELIVENKPDLLVVLGWSEILPERILKIPTIGTIGTHASLLPHNRGSAPINWAIIHGEKVTGNTMMWLAKDVDAGDIIDQIAFPITVYDTCKTLYDQVAVTNATMLEKLIDNLEKGIISSALVKNETDEPILPRRRPKDGVIHWNQKGYQIYDFIRALTKPYPGAYSYLNGEKWLIWEATLLPLSSTTNGLKPGEILGNSYSFCHETNGILVGTESEILLVTEMENSTGDILSGVGLNDLKLRGTFENE